MRSRRLRMFVITVGAGIGLSLGAATGRAAPPDQADLSVTASVDKPQVVVGEQFKFSYEVQNSGPMQSVQPLLTATGSSTAEFRINGCSLSVRTVGGLIDEFNCNFALQGPGPVTIGEHGANWINPPPDLPDGEARILGTFEGLATTPGVLTVNFVASADTADPNGANNSVSVQVEIIPAGDLRMGMSVGVSPTYDNRLDLPTPPGSEFPRTAYAEVGDEWHAYWEVRNFGPGWSLQPLALIGGQSTATLQENGCFLTVRTLGGAIDEFICNFAAQGPGVIDLATMGANRLNAPPQVLPDEQNRMYGAVSGTASTVGVIDLVGVASSDTPDSMPDNDMASARIYVLPPAPTPANGFLSPSTVRTAGGTLVVAAALDLGDKSVDFSGPTTLTFGSQVIAIPGGLKPNRRGTQWSWLSGDRKVRLVVLPPRKQNRTSRGRVGLVVRNWSGMLPPYPGGGDALDLRLQAGAFDVQSTVQLVGGAHRLNTQLASDPPVVLDRVAAYLSGHDTPRIAVTASFAGDGVVPGLPPNVVLRMGEPGSPYRTVVPSSDHIVTPTATGYRYTIPDPDGPGPLLPQGPWFVEVDFVHRRVEAHVRGEDLGSFPRLTAPFLFSFGLEDVEHAVQVCVDNRNGSRLSYR